MGSRASATTNKNSPEYQAKRAGYGSWAPDTTGAPVVWDEVEPHILMEALMAVSEAGDALTLGKTRDGGALVVTVLCDAGPVKRYASTAIEATSLLRALTSAAPKR